MVVLEDPPAYKREQTLLTKYEIPLQNLDYRYIEKCTDGRELEKIVKILQSGEEGYFPDLTEVAEKRLAVVKPKSKLLMRQTPVLEKCMLTKEERNALDNDLKDWVECVSKNDSSLEKYKRIKSQRHLPEIRETKEGSCDAANEEKPKRIGATDYSSWDQYDVDTEMLKIDLEEEKIKKQAIKDQNQSKSTRKAVQFKDFQTNIEMQHESCYEKEKGNEFFKTCDYNEALRHYTKSINCRPTIEAYNNRALTHIKLKSWKLALEDCDASLGMDVNNVKALVRKTQALVGQKKYDVALSCIEKAIKIDPNNSYAQEIASKLRKGGSGSLLKHRRFAIEDVGSGTGKILLSIPGSSKTPPPYIIEFDPNASQQSQLESIRACNLGQQILHLVAVDDCENEDEDGCPINHLEHRCSEKFNKTKKLMEKTESKANVPVEVQAINEETIIDEDNVVENEPLNECKASTSKRKVIKDDKGAGGEPFTDENENEFIEMPEDIHSPYSFLKAWNSANADSSLETQATILKCIDMTRISEVIGCKLDNSMFSRILQCLHCHFAVPAELDRLHQILENLVNLPRFEIIALLMSDEDRTNVKLLINFLNQHDKKLPDQTQTKLLNQY